MYVQCNIERRRCNYRCSGKALRTAFSECVSVALGIQYVMRTSRVALSSVVWPDLQFFSLYLINCTNLEKCY
jgi:hypothetical protein